MNCLPNILYLHAHDAGRYVQPYGVPVETPHLMAFAQESTLFRKAFCVAPTCGPSRAALLTGQYPHEMGMFGLPGKAGWKIDEPRKHLVHHLNKLGYETVLAGVQHEADHADFSCLGYERVLESEAPVREQAGEFYPETIDKVERYLATRADNRPFFLSVGIDEPHRDNIARPELNLRGDSTRFSKTRAYNPDRLDWRYTAPPPWLPDLPEIRRDMESYREGVRIMDMYMGRVLDALYQLDLEGNTLVVVTTDHGIEFPGGKKTLSDQGLQVMLMIRGPEGSPFSPGTVVEPMVTQLDLYPTFCDMLGGSLPEHALSGKSLLPLVRGDVESLHDYVYCEQTEHGGALEPLRSVRSERYKYVLRQDTKGPAMRHDGPATALMEKAGWYDRDIGNEELFDLYLDPMEACNRIADPAYADIRNELRSCLDKWMLETRGGFVESRNPCCSRHSRNTNSSVSKTIRRGELSKVAFPYCID